MTSNPQSSKERKKRRRRRLVYIASKEKAALSSYSVSPFLFLPLSLLSSFRLFIAATKISAHFLISLPLLLLGYVDD